MDTSFLTVLEAWNARAFMLSCSALSLCNPMDCNPQAPLSIGFSRQEYQSGLPFPTSGELPDPGIEPASLVSPASLYCRQILATLSYLGSAEARKSRIKVPARQVSSGGLLPWHSRWLPSHSGFTQPLLCAHGAGSTCFLVSLLQKLL